MTTAGQPANWYTDPTGRHQYRYWNGAEWTDQVADNQITSTDPPVMPSAGAAAAAAPAAAPATAAVGPPVAPSPKAPARRGNALWAWIACGGALLLIVGSFLDAATASIGSVSSSKNYIDGDGPITLVIGLAIVVVAVLVGVGVIPRWGGWLIAGLGAVGALVAIIDIFDVKDDVDTINNFGGDASIGPALWLCLVGGVIAVACGVLAFVTAKADSA